MVKMMSKGKILIVEDEPNIAEAMQVNLEGAGYEVLTAADGMEALRLFDEFHPDLTTVDLMLPSISGFRLIKLLKRAGPPGQVLVIVISALSFEEGEDAVRSGADAYITKPLDPAQLVHEVDYLLGRHVASV